MWVTLEQLEDQMIKWSETELAQAINCIYMDEF